MKRTVVFAIIGALMAALTASAAPNKSKSSKKGNARSSHAQVAKGGGHHNASHPAKGRTNRHVSAPKRNSRAAASNARTHSRNSFSAQQHRKNSHANVNRNNRVSSARKMEKHQKAVNNRNVRNFNRSNGVRNDRVTAERNRANARALNQAATIDRANRAALRANNARVVNNWRSERFSGNNYTAFRDYRRQWHDRDWWHNHYTRIILVSGGWWYWNAGYWYPAWGYDPYYSYYPYDGPIYSYGDLTPDRIIINVQAQLRDDGYYVGAIDGVLGPQTRRALAAFQADHGLAVTSAVDEPTLATLGLS